MLVERAVAKAQVPVVRPGADGRDHGEPREARVPRPIRGRVEQPATQSRVLRAATVRPERLGRPVDVQLADQRRTAELLSLIHI